MVKISITYAAVAALIATVASGAVIKRQGNDEVYQGNESQMTAAENATRWILPVKREMAQKMANEKLLTPTGLEQYLKSDEHPLLVTSAYLTDIRQLDLRVDALRTTTVSIPFVDSTGDGKTPVDKQYVVFQSQVIPALVGSIAGGNKIIYSVFDPPSAPYKPIGSGIYSDLVSVGIDNKLPVLGGPGYLHPVFQTTFKENPSPMISADTFKSIANQIQEKPVGNLCVRPQYLTNYTQAQPFFTKASDFETYPPSTPSDMSVRDRVEGYSASVQWIYPAGFGQPCKSFAGKGSSA